MKENVLIEKLDYEARGIAYIDNKVTFVSGALPEEVVNIEITKDKKNYNDAKVIDYIRVSNKRINTICPYEKCGGCELSHISYEDELEFKQSKVNDLFKRKCNFDKVSNIIKADKIYNYRNKITLNVKGGKLGLYQKDSHNLVNINHCFLVDDKINNVIKSLEKTNLSGIDKITIRASNETMVIYESNSNKQLILDSNNIVLKNKNKYKVIKGNNYINESLNNLTYKIELDSFFQINKSQTIKLYDKVIELGHFKKSDKVLELYCGTGSISLYIANYVKKVIGVEINENAVRSANYNKELNNITNTEFICKNANDISIDFKPDVVVVDPPRSGLDKKTILFLNNIKAKKIIYISCSPLTLVRDINLLEEYEIKEVVPIDMFPRTSHVECVVLLQKKN